MAVLQRSDGRLRLHHPAAEPSRRAAGQRARHLDLEQPDDPRCRRSAKDFYAQVFGWTAIHNEQAPPGVDMWQVEGQRWPEGHAGLMEITDDLPADMPSHWQVYFIVENADAAIEKAESRARSSASARSTSQSAGSRRWSILRARWSRSPRRATPSRGSYFRAQSAQRPLTTTSARSGWKPAARRTAAGALQVERGVNVLDPPAVAADHVMVGVGARVPEEGARRRR